MHLSSNIMTMIYFRTTMIFPRNPMIFNKITLSKYSRNLSLNFMTIKGNKMTISLNLKPMNMIEIVLLNILFLSLAGQKTIRMKYKIILVNKIFNV